MSADAGGVVASASDPEEPPASASTLAALGDRNFFPYFVGNLLSSCGTWFHNIAQTLFVYRATGSVFLVGVVNLCQFASVFLLGAKAGVAADVVDRRRLLLTTQVASAAISGVLALLAGSGHLTVPVMVVAALALGVAHTFSTPAMLALVPQLVEPVNLGPAVALNIVTLNVARAIGPVLGALVVDQLGIPAAFGLNALSFTALIVGLLIVVPRPTPLRDRSIPLRLRDTMRGIRRRPELMVLFIAGTCASMTIDPVNTLSPGFATDVFHRPDTLVGWLVGAFGFGAVVAGVTVSRQPHADDRVIAHRIGLLVLAFVVFAATSYLPIALIALAVAGFAYIASTAAALTRVQHSTDPGEHGRMTALWSMAFMGSRPIASVIDGGVASWTNVRVATWLMVLPAVFGGWLLLARSRADAIAQPAA